MNHHYKDIIDKVGVPPSWWDEHAVPRFCVFSPAETANIYADECCLLLILCQQCGHKFDVCLSSSGHDRINFVPPHKPHPLLSERVAAGAVEYGDPPNYCDCSAGATMYSVPVRVKEFWKRDWQSPQLGWDWVRVPELEVEVWPEWMPRQEAG